MVAVFIDKLPDVGSPVIDFLSKFKERKQTFSPVSLQSAMAHMKQPAHVLIVQRFVVILKNTCGIDEQFQVFANLIYSFGKFFHPFGKTLVIDKHEKIIFVVSVNINATTKVYTNFFDIKQIRASVLKLRR